MRATEERASAMQETAEEITTFERLLSASIERAGAFVRESLQMPEHSLSAAQLLRYWVRFLTTAVATTTARGEPRVAPTGVALYRGRFVVPTVAAAARTKAVLARPAVSLSRFDEGDVAVIVHGHATVVGQGDVLFADLTALHRELANGEDVTRWKGEGVYLVVAPARLYTFARFPDNFPTA